MCYERLRSLQDAVLTISFHGLIGSGSHSALGLDWSQCCLWCYWYCIHPPFIISNAKLCIKFREAGNLPWRQDSRHHLTYRLFKASKKLEVTSHLNQRWNNMDTFPISLPLRSRKPHNRIYWTHNPCHCSSLWMRFIIVITMSEHAMRIEANGKKCHPLRWLHDHCTIFLNCTSQGSRLKACVCTHVW